jgi:hypothetical protein
MVATTVEDWIGNAAENTQPYRNPLLELIWGVNADTADGVTPAQKTFGRVPFWRGGSGRASVTVKFCVLPSPGMLVGDNENAVAVPLGVKFGLSR